MYNANRPAPDELPSSTTLLRSTVIALIVAVVILVTVVLPAEYGIDPVGAGRLLGLTEVGEIKTQLAAEAEAEAHAASGGGAGAETNAPSTVDTETTAGQAFPEELATPGEASDEPEPKRDEITIELAPGQGAEVKLVMKAGERAEFSWTAHGSVVNFDLHGSGGGRSISYEKGRGVPGDDGVIEAAFDGNHGWFWRNRTEASVKVTLRTSGSYTELKRTV